MTGEASVDLGRPPTTYAEAVAHVDAGTDRGSLESFETPSGNIFCALTVQDLPTGCEIGDGATADLAVCTEPSISGESVTTRDTRCTSEEVGVTCVARSGVGALFLRRGQHALLNP